MNFELVVCKEIETNILTKYNLSNYHLKKDLFLHEFKKSFIEDYSKIEFLNVVNLSNVRVRIQSQISESIKARVYLDEVDSETFVIHLFKDLYTEFILNDNSINFSSLILHELVHFMDIALLKEIKNEFNLNKFKFKSLDTFHSSVQWLFIHLLSTIRNEGVAILGEKILSGDNDFLSQEEAFKMLENDLNLAISLCHSTLYRDNITLNELKKTLLSIEENAYNYADVVLFHMLRNNQLNKTSLDLTYSKSDDFSFSSLKTLEAAFMFDLSEWIRELLKIEMNNQVHFQIDYSKFSELSQLLIRNENLNQNQANFESILLFAYQNKGEDFIEFIKHITDCKLDYLIIQQKLKTNEFIESSHDIYSDILVLANRLFESRNHMNQELIDWSLSYLFNKSDVLSDELSFLGLQDDWMVLEATSILINKK